jgi:hypothetical protein
MKFNQLFALAAIALSCGAVSAQQASVTPATPLTRAQVRQSVLEARLAGRLAHTGSVAPEEEMKAARAHPSSSTLTRAEQGDSVRQARAAGRLAHAGSVAPEEEMMLARAHPSTSTLSRAEVKSEVIEARANGTLIPAGEGGYARVSPVPARNWTILAARSVK